MENINPLAEIEADREKEITRRITAAVCEADEALIEYGLRGRQRPKHNHLYLTAENGHRYRITVEEIS